jgi:hypothetical protein
MKARTLIHSKKDLLAAGTKFADQTGKQRPDRLCHREKDAMICWMCDNVPNFPVGFPPVPIYVAKPPRPQVPQNRQPAPIAVEADDDWLANCEGEFGEYSDLW